MDGMYKEIGPRRFTCIESSQERGIIKRRFAFTRPILDVGVYKIGHSILAYTEVIV